MAIAAVVLKVVLGAAFLGSGGGKLLSAKMVAEESAHLRYPQGFLRFIAVAEFLGGAGLIVGIWVRVWATLAAVGLAILMAGAVYSHLGRAKDPLSRVVPSAVLLILAVAAIVIRG